MEYIPLEKPIADLELRIDELRRLATSQAINLDREIGELNEKAKQLRQQIFSALTPYESVQLARHPRRPTTIDLVGAMCSNFIELHGDRNFYDDKAIVGGIAKINTFPVVIIGHQKGKDTKDCIYRNFGMPKPEGYRKALRLMSLAERFGLPIVTLINTPGAYPGIGAEERGQSEAIAKNIMVMARLKVPIIVIIVGEGGSGGALALGVGNRVHMLKTAFYSVISPEGCASILMKDASKASDAAVAMKITATDALSLGIIDSIVDEPEGGAHRSIDITAQHIKKQILKDLMELKALSPNDLSEYRIKKFLAMGQFVEKVLPHKGSLS